MGFTFDYMIPGHSCGVEQQTKLIKLVASNNPSTKPFISN